MRRKFRNLALATIATWLVTSSLALAQDAPTEVDPIVEEAPVVAEDAPVVAEESPVVAEETPTVVEETPVVAEETPTVVEEAPVVVEETPVVEETAPPPDQGVTARIGGEYRFRFNMMSDVPLRPLPRTDPAQSGELGQNYWGEQWFRLRGELRVVPELRFVGQMDLLRGVAFGDLAQGVGPEALQRDAYGYPGIRLRFLYLEWLTDIGVLRVGQMGFSWGLGIVANDGDTPPVFGDYRYGDLVRRILFALTPLGRSTPFVVALAADWVGWDLLADFERRGDLAFQGVLASYYGDDLERVGAYGAYRWQQNPMGATLAAGFVDVYARWGFADDAGGRVYAAVEGAYGRGTTTYAQSVENPEHLVEQLLGVVQVGRTSPDFDVILEAGYASGDSNGDDAIQGRATIDPDHRVGLVLFPEVLSAQSARSAYLAADPLLGARPTRGNELLPTNGGVSGAAYLFPYAIMRPLPWLELRLGGVLAIATSDVVDPFAQRALGVSTNYRGGRPGARELGIEVDGAVLMHHPIADDLVLSGGVEGGLLVPGPAFEDAMGVGVGPIGLLRFRIGLRYL